VTEHSWVVFEKLGVVWNSSAWCGIFLVDLIVISMVTRSS
jgi:hypothetical protein